MGNNSGKLGEKASGMPPLHSALWEEEVMMSHGIPGLLAVSANQRAFSCHVITIVEGCKTSNVVLSTMGNTKSFIQLVNMHWPRPCLTPVGLESDNKKYENMPANVHVIPRIV